MLRVLFILLLPLLFTPQLRAQSKCELVKSAYDVDAEEIALVVAKIDKCQKKIIRIYIELKEPMPLTKILSSKRLSDKKKKMKLQNKLLKLIKSLHKKATAYKSTSSIIKTHNVLELLPEYKKFKSDIQKALNANFTESSLRQRAILNYYAAKSMAKIKSEHISVWDISENQMSFATHKEKEGFLTFNAMLGSTQFFDKFHKEVMEKNPSKKKPLTKLSQRQIKKGIALARQYIRKNISGNLRLAMLKTDTVGQGIVHINGFEKIIHKGKSYQQKDIHKFLNNYNKSIKKFKERKQGYMIPSNLILALGVMQELGIAKVTIANVTPLHGLLFYGL